MLLETAVEPQKKTQLVREKVGAAWSNIALCVRVRNGEGAGQLSTSGQRSRISANKSGVFIFDVSETGTVTENLSPSAECV